MSTESESDYDAKFTKFLGIIEGGGEFESTIGLKVLLENPTVLGAALSKVVISAETPFCNKPKIKGLNQKMVDWVSEKGERIESLLVAVETSSSSAGSFLRMARSSISA